MQVYPTMDIRFPESKEAELFDSMRHRASPPWQWQTHDAFGRPPENDSFYFHRDEGDIEPPCTLCMQREAPGHFVIHAIVPDTNTVHKLPVEQYVRIMQEFDEQIAGPATEALEGMTSIGTSKHRLEDYFSAEAIQLLERFCSTSNAADWGSHPSDQDKWMAFLVYVHRSKENVHCDTFGACLKAKEWWPEVGIPILVSEYDFAMRLLRRLALSSSS